MAVQTGGSLEGLYQQVILDHAKERHGYGLRGLTVHDAPGVGAEGPVRSGHIRSGQSRQYNPLCGDEVTLQVSVTSRMVEDLSWSGEGCSISQAATSVLYDLVVGHPVDEALKIVGDYRAMLRGRGEVEPDEEVLGDAIAFAGVGRHANRVKCAILGWAAFEAALLDAGLESPSSSEASPSDALPGTTSDPLPGTTEERFGR
jgi:nitrogen fixation NifU-like protein